jgi:hypothetical protein
MEQNNKYIRPRFSELPFKPPISMATLQEKGSRSHSPGLFLLSSHNILLERKKCEQRQGKENGDQKQRGK